MFFDVDTSDYYGWLYAHLCHHDCTYYFIFLYLYVDKCSKINKLDINWFRIKISVNWSYLVYVYGYNLYIILKKYVLVMFIEILLYVTIIIRIQTH